MIKSKCFEIYERLTGKPACFNRGMKAKNILRRGIDELGSDGKTGATVVAGQSRYTQESHLSNCNAVDVVGVCQNYYVENMAMINEWLLNLYACMLCL